MVLASTSVPVTVLIWVAIAGAVANIANAVSGIAGTGLGWWKWIRQLKAQHADTVQMVARQNETLADHGAVLDEIASKVGVDSRP